MEKSVSSVHNKNRVVDSSQRKRLRSNSPMQEEEIDSYAGLSQKKVKKTKFQISKRKKPDSIANNGNRAATMSSLPSGSSISISSSTSGKANANKKTIGEKSALRIEPRGKENRSKSAVNDCINEKNSKGKSSHETAQRTSSNANRSQPVASHAKALPLSSNNQQRLSNRILQSSQQFRDLNTSSSSGYASSVATSHNFNGDNTFSRIDPLIESSLEYRELKRLYLQEQNQCQEWRKDYNVVKKQLENLKSTTIPRPTAEVLEWIQELLYLINDKNSFVGDGRDLKTIGEDLNIDQASLATVIARTPQKTSLKIFRLLYPTIASRAECVSISRMCQVKLRNIYLYARNLHKNLNFSVDEFRKAIGTSIRSARRDMQRQLTHFEERENALQNQGDRNPENSDERSGDAANEESTFDSSQFLSDEVEVDDLDQSDEENDEESEEEGEDAGSSEGEGVSEDELGNNAVDRFVVDEELDVDSD